MVTIAVVTATVTIVTTVVTTVTMETAVVVAVVVMVVAVVVMVAVVVAVAVVMVIRARRNEDTEPSFSDANFPEDKSLLKKLQQKPLKNREIPPPQKKNPH